jgi:hypothetical protein
VSNATHKDATWFTNGPLIYGVTVQIAAYQCLSGDQLFLNKTFPGKTVVFEPSVCALWISSATTDDVEPYKEIVGYVRFSTTQLETARQQLSFVAVWWTEPQLKNLVVDADRGIVYGTMSVTPKNWEQSYDACRAVSPNWNLMEVNTEPVDPLAKRVSSTTELPIGMILMPNQKFGLISRDPILFTHWAAGYPNVASGQCVKIKTDGTWVNIPCSTASFSTVMCEHRNVGPKYHLSYVANESLWLAEMIVPIFTNASGELMPDSNTDVWGATIHAQAGQCLIGDMIFVNASFPSIGVFLNDDCTVYLVGRAQVRDYNVMLKASHYRGQLFRRIVMKFSYILWIDPYARMPVRDHSTGHIYTSFNLNAPMNARPEYPQFGSISDICTATGSYPAEVTSLQEAAEQSRTTRFGDQYLGVQRVGTTQGLQDRVV